MEEDPQVDRAATEVRLRMATGDLTEVAADGESAAAPKKSKKVAKAKSSAGSKGPLSKQRSSAKLGRGQSSKSVRDTGAEVPKDVTEQGPMAPPKDSEQLSADAPRDVTEQKPMAPPPPLEDEKAEGDATTTAPGSSGDSGTSSPEGSPPPGRSSKASKRSSGRARPDIGRLMSGDGAKGAEVVPPVMHPTAFERLTVKYYHISCGSWFAFSIVWVIIAQAMINSGHLILDRTGVWQVRSDTVQSQIDAFTEATKLLGGPPKKNESEIPDFEERSQMAGTTDILMFSRGTEDLLSAKNLAFLREAERRLMKVSVMMVSGMTDLCQLSKGAAGPAVAVTSVDASTGVLALDGSPPANGSTVIFRGTASGIIGLADGGWYIAEVEGSGVRLLASDGLGLNFTSTATVEGGKLFVVEAQCVAPSSVAVYGLPAPAEHEAAICAGHYAAATSEWGQTVSSPVCGCANGTALGGADCAGGPRGLDCRGQFGGGCLSSRYVDSSAPAEGDPKASPNVVNLCANGTQSDQLWKFKRAMVLPSSWSCVGGVPGPATELVRSAFPLGFPLKGFTKVEGETVGAQTGIVAEWSKGKAMMEVMKLQQELNAERGGEVEVLIMNNYFLGNLIQAVITNDAVFALGSGIFVWLWVWCSTGSTLLASMCIYEVIVSLPMAMAALGIVGQRYIGFLCSMMFFVILGIGADDVFVLFDAWKQSALMGFGDDTLSRFTWTYRTAGKAMMVTTLTTCFCFAAAGFSSIPSISGFGWFAALVVLFDYFLVMTLFASTVLVYHYHFERKNSIAELCGSTCCTGHMGCCPNKVTAIDPARPLWQQERLMAPPLVLFIIGFALMFTPAAFLGALLICGAIIYPHGVMSGQASAKEARPIEAFFEKKFYPFVERHALKLVIPASVIVLALIIVAAVGLKPPDENDKFLRESHPAQMYLDALGKFNLPGGYRGRNLAQIVYGIDKDVPFDRTGVDPQQPGPSWQDRDRTLGKVVYRDEAIVAMSSKAGREGVISTCDAARESRISEQDTGCELVVMGGFSVPRLFSPERLKALEDDGSLTRVDASPAGSRPRFVASPNVTWRDLPELGDGFCSIGVDCFMYDVRDYLEHFCDGDPDLPFGMPPFVFCYVNGMKVGGAGSFADESLDLRAVIESAGFGMYFYMLGPRTRGMAGNVYSGYSRQRATGIILQEGKLLVAFVGVNVSVPSGRMLPFMEQAKIKDRMLTFIEQNRAQNPNAFLVMNSFGWVITSQALQKSVSESVAIALAFSWVVLVCTTWNVLVGTLALLVVGSIVAGAFGLMVIIGWSLGIIESVACIVIIGVAVDYSVHVAHAYQEAEVHDESAADGVPDKSKERGERVRMALGSIGISLVSGVSTSLGATAFLFFCNVTLFSKFGILLFMTLATSFAFCFLFLVPLLFLIGPAGGQGNLPALPFARGKEVKDASVQGPK